jgi:hypothetical protein
VRRLRRGTGATNGEPDVTGWRLDRLCERGFSRHLAGQLAADRRWDLHGLLELVDRGCPAELAVRILLPLDDESLDEESQAPC